MRNQCKGKIRKNFFILQGLISIGLFSIALFSTPIFSATQDKQNAVFIITDNMRAMQYTIYNDNWVLNPVGKYGLHATFSQPSPRLLVSLDLRDEVVTKTAQEALQAEVKFLKRDSEVKIVSQDESAKVADSLNAVGLLWHHSKTKAKHQLLWFNYGNILYKIECEAEAKYFDAGQKQCMRFLENIKLLK